VNISWRINKCAYLSDETNHFISDFNMIIDFKVERFILEKLGIIIQKHMLEPRDKVWSKGAGMKVSFNKHIFWFQNRNRSWLLF
jgi:hypothetical protein